MKKLKILGTIFILILIMTGCTDKQAKDATENTFIIKSGDSIVDVSVAEFDKDYYNSSEIEQYVEDEVNNYKQASDGGSVKINSYDLTDNIAKLIMTYDSIKTYNEFNNTDFILDNSSNVSIEGNFVSVADNTDVSIDKMDIEGTKIFTANEDTRICVDGKILYYQGEVQLIDESTIYFKGNGEATVIYK